MLLAASARSAIETAGASPANGGCRQPLVRDQILRQHVQITTELRALVRAPAGAAGARPERGPRAAGSVAPAQHTPRAPARSSPPAQASPATQASPWALAWTLRNSPPAHPSCVRGGADGARNRARGRAGPRRRRPKRGRAGDRARARGQQVTAQAWSLAALSGCLPVPVALGAVTGVTVIGANGPELDASSQLTPADLATPASDFANPTESPLIYSDGTGIVYDRPWRGGQDANAADPPAATQRPRAAHAY